MSRNLVRLAAAALFVVLLAGCAGIQVGQPFDLQRFETSVEHGVTTQDDVQRWLGAPHATGFVVDRDGSRAVRWHYFHGQGVPGRSDARVRTLEIRFDGQRRVEGYEWSSTD